MRALPSDGTPVNEGVSQTGNHRAGAISSEILFIRGGARALKVGSAWLAIIQKVNSYVVALIRISQGE